ncbi:MAG: TetR/AcrR family transcriptional regulator, partial [Planctomycetota bacterium]|nr:TetR/AcrR family transcriptional regulator [Planctomycetota bacterium]
FGIKKSSMREIAKDAGMAVGTLYLYFKNKDEMVLAFVEKYRERHKIAAQSILKSRINASEKLTKYLVHRFEESKATRHGTPFAEEITEAVLRCCPTRLQEEGEEMMANVRQILLEGCKKEHFSIEDIDRDVEVLLYSIAWFFPTALAPVLIEPEQEAFLKVVNWFCEKWRGN